MKTIHLYFFTIIHLRPIQIYYQVFNKIRLIFRKIIGHKYPQFIHAQSFSISLQPSISSNKSYFPNENRFCFLNQEQVFPKQQINWNDEQIFGKLWAYNLNYFDFLSQKDLSQAKGIALIRAYIYAYPTLKTGLESYPISLRNINWIKFLSKYQIQDTEIDAFLMAKYVRLSDNLEYHLMGNHLLENGFSLLFGGVYFRKEAFLKLAKNILKTELSEQILADGCHFERSVMYHQIILFRLLDCLNLLQNNRALNLVELENEIAFYAQKMLGFLQTLTFQNGEIPLMGDAAKNITPTTFQLLEYAQLLNIEAQKIDFSASDYRKFEEENVELLLNVGRASPDYLPAHSHCDIFNFILYVDEKPFIVDTGTSTYQNNERRHFERSTVAHNTVQIGDFEQSEIWSSFRIGRRAKVKILTDSQKEILALHDGFQKIGIAHQRSFKIENRQIIIVDKVLGGTNYPVKAYLHFHPDVGIKVFENTISTNLGTIYFENISRIEQNTYFYAEQFNKTIPAKMLTIYFTNSLKTIIDSTKKHENTNSNLLFSA
ncbi:heparinase II/III-like protein [Arcicella aurantiaca]|uniref:Heparinase II/III-like protein n=1 Tax=Arcicella aurantiaca TaxID=591202 RepID=A0A316DUB7_9BACT|nr:alginate lyase family protein [Arcicella aurantiaca]PWK21396.1 heparinase II/III-like protein [Arcicella aurantiaca]